MYENQTHKQSSHSIYKQEAQTNGWALVKGSYQPRQTSQHWKGMMKLLTTDIDRQGEQMKGNEGWTS